jgi:hypothetical protein
MDRYCRLGAPSTTSEMDSIHWCRRLSLPRKKFNGADHWSVEVERPGA